MAIYDRIARSPCRTVAIGTGLVASAATAVLQAADERLITVNTSLLIHDGLEAYEGDPKSFEEWGRAAKAGRRLLYEIYASRSKKSVAYWERKCAHDTILTAEKVIEEGLADRIIIPAKKKDLNGTK